MDQDPHMKRKTLQEQFLLGQEKTRAGEGWCYGGPAE